MRLLRFSTTDFAVCCAYLFDFAFLPERDKKIKIKNEKRMGRKNIECSATLNGFTLACVFGKMQPLNCSKF